MQFDRILFLCADDSALGPLAEELAIQRLGDAVQVECVRPSSPPRTLHEGELLIALGEAEPDGGWRGGLRPLRWAVPEARTEARDRLSRRLEVLAALRDMPPPLAPVEFHASVRVPDLAAAARFYTWLLGVEPKEWTHRFVTFVSEALRTNFVVLVDDGKPLHQDTLYHLGIELPDRAGVIDAHHRAVAAGWTLHKPARTTWRGTPLHELWLKDPGGNLVEIYARLTEIELAEMPADKEPVFLAAKA